MYSYQTFPGQTMIRTVQNGFSDHELMDELARNGEGTITLHEHNSPDEFLQGIAGIHCNTIRAARDEVDSSR